MTDNDREEWSQALFESLRGAGISLFCYVPDAGNKRLIELAMEANDTRTVLLTSEEEGVAMCAGADLVGERGVLCMQSSGVGNCVNYLSLVKGGRFPLLLLITMRGDYGEENPWQYPMGEAVEPVLAAMGVTSYRVESRADLERAAAAVLGASGKGGQAAALVLTQKFLGAKAF